MKRTIRFYECDNHIDLSLYKDDLIKCGAKILDLSLNSEDEVGDIMIEVDDPETFEFKFENTDSYHFAECLWEKK